MHGSSRYHWHCSRLASVVLAAFLVVGFLAGHLGAGPGKPAAEVRALWVRSASLATPAAVTAMVKSAKQGGFNTLLVQVRSRGDSFFNGGLEPRAAVLDTQPDWFDPLGLTITLAHAQGMRVHAWIDIGLVSSATWLPASRAHVVYRHPEWLMVPRALARDMVLLDAQGQLYLDKLVRWTKAQGADVEGLYVSPVPEEAAAATVAIVADIVAAIRWTASILDYVGIQTTTSTTAAARSRPFGRMFCAVWTRPLAGPGICPPLRTSSLGPRRSPMSGAASVATGSPAWSPDPRERQGAAKRRNRLGGVPPIRPTRPTAACRIGEHGCATAFSTWCARWPTRAIVPRSPRSRARQRDRRASARLGRHRRVSALVLRHGRKHPHRQATRGGGRHPLLRTTRSSVCRADSIIWRRSLAPHSHNRDTMSGFRTADASCTRQRRTVCFPCAVVEVGDRSRVLWRQACGRMTFDIHAPEACDETFFDLASLTKVLATSVLAMRLVDSGTLALDARVADILPSWKGPDRRRVRIVDLLAHSSGLPAHRPGLRDVYGACGIRSRHRVGAARVRAGHPKPLQRSRVHPAWICAGGHGGRTARRAVRTGARPG